MAKTKMPIKNGGTTMKWIAAMLCITSYGIIEGSDVQGYELTSATWALLITCMIAAIGIMFYEIKKEDTTNCN